MRNIQAESEYLRKALELRRKLQGFLDRNAGYRSQTWVEFILDGDRHLITPRQRRILMEMAPEDVRKANE